MKTLCIVQARMGSSRLPKKVMKEINKIPMIHLLLKRLELSDHIDDILVATTTNHEDKELYDYVTSEGYLCEKGSENNVLERFAKASLKYKADVVIRITGDCPLVDPEIVDNVIKLFKKNNVDYCSNVLPPTFPDGMDVEVFSSSAYRSKYKTKKLMTKTYNSFIRNSPNIQKNYEHKKIFLN